MRTLIFLLALPLCGQQFPAIEGQNLREHRVKLPDGHGAVAIIGFTHASQSQTKAWSVRVGKQFPVWSIAVMEDVPRLARGMASHGIKSGVPEDQRERFLLVYHGEKELQQAAGFTAPDDAYVLAIDQGGVIRWRFHGPVTDAAWEQLKAHMAVVEGPPIRPKPY